MKNIFGKNLMLKLVLVYALSLLLVWLLWEWVKASFAGAGDAIAAPFRKAAAAVKETFAAPVSQEPAKRDTWDNIKGVAYAEQGDRALSDIWDFVTLSK